MKPIDVLTEDETLDACQTLSISRFGDGELRLAIGGDCSSQKGAPKLAAELRAILATYQGFVVGVPNFARTPNRDTWDRYREPKYARLMTQPTYGSAFITRPDNAPWIDNEAYWSRVRALWEGKDVVLVTGDSKSLTPEMLKGAASLRTVTGPRQHAYAQVDEIEAETVSKLKEGGRAILCLGATATVLAARLARRGFHALDLGHIGMFMRHAGLYVDPASLISKDYRRQNEALHTGAKPFGADGRKHAFEVLPFAEKIGARSICDYGCGQGTLKKALEDRGFSGYVGEYDPAIPKRAKLPKPVALVVCTDVLEHVEPDRLDAVLAHLRRLGERGWYFCIATRPANRILPDGRNAHLIVETAEWWRAKLCEFWTPAQIKRFEVNGARDVCVWIEA